MNSVKARASALAALLLALPLAIPAGAQTSPPATSLPRTPKECQAVQPGSQPPGRGALPNIASALKERRKLNILAIGASSIERRATGTGSYLQVVEQYLEHTYKGLDVVIINRGVSGELARDAAERIRTEVALASADLVLWQVGTADALAQVPVEDLSATLTETIRWLRGHKIDVVLITLHYARAMAKDQHYQAVRKALRDVARREQVLRIGRYEAVEMLDTVKSRENGRAVDEQEVTDDGYLCMADQVARLLAAGLFARDGDKLEPLPTPNAPQGEK